MTATRDQFFKPEKMSAQARAEQGHSVVRDIIDAETVARDTKTAKLRALRLSQQDEQAAGTASTLSTRRGKKPSATK